MLANGAFWRRLYGFTEVRDCPGGIVQGPSFGLCKILAVHS